MRIVFWQNCLSPHQMPYIVELIRDRRVDTVVVLAGEAVSDSRREMGWETPPPEMEQCELYVAPGPDMIEYQLSERVSDSWHLFSGIRAFPFVFDAFRKSLKYDLHRGLITERPFTYAGGNPNGKPLWLHAIRFWTMDLRYARRVRKVFAIGKDAPEYYKGVWNKWDVYPFAYCTRIVDCSNVGGSDSRPMYSKETVRFLFIGELSARKAPMDIVKAVTILRERGKSFDIQIDLVGDGKERRVIEQYISSENVSCVHMLGVRRNSEIPEILSNHDVLILPSIYDGWGAVVNEALMEGVYVICSDQCGARELLTDSSAGAIYSCGNSAKLADVMEQTIQQAEKIRDGRQARMMWARTHIDGRSVSRYLVDCLQGIESEVPWKR